MSSAWTRARFVYRNLKARFRDQPEEIKALLGAARRGNTIVDVGANKGAYLYWMSRAAGPLGHVAAFEPQPALADYLRKIVELCRLENVTIEQKAVSERSGASVLHIPGGGSSPGASLEDAVQSREACREVDVEVVTLDDYFRDPTARISVIKVDVEGHELSVFRGAERILREHSPVLIFETENRHLSSGTVFDVLNYLREFGYRGWFICRNALLPVEQFIPELHQRQQGDRFWDHPSYCNNFIMKKDQPR